MRENRKRISHDCQIGDLAHEPGKMEPRACGEFPITKVHCDGSVTIQLSPVVTERINIRRIKPYRK